MLYDYFLNFLTHIHFIQKLSEAANLYERIENWDQAASCYIRLKNWTKVGEYASYITSTKIHAQYAKVKA